MDVTPRRALGVFLGLLLCLASLGMIVVGIGQLSQAAISALLLVWAVLPILGTVLGGMAAYRVHGLLTARYVLDRNGLGIRWGQAIEEIPLPLVHLVRPDEGERRQLRPRPGLRWPGCVVGSARSEDLGEVEFFSTGGPDRMLLVRTDSRTLAISPPDLDAFQRAFVAASRQGVLDPIEPRSERPDLFPARLWRDPVARALLVPGVGLPLMLLGFLGLRAGSLPPLVPFGFDPAGNPNPLVPPGRLLILPLVGGLWWGVNLAIGTGFYRKAEDRTLAHAVWGATILVELLAWGAALVLLAAA